MASPAMLYERRKNMSKARPKQKEMDRLTRTEMERAIYEANLGTEDEKIARMYFVEKLPQIEIGMELMLDRKTVGARLKKIEERIQRVLGGE